MTTIDSAPNSGNDDAGSIDEQLDEAKNQLADVQAQSADLSEREAELQATIRELQAWSDKATRTRDGYEAVYPELIQHDAACRQYLAAETDCLESIIGDRSDDIDRAVHPLVAEVTTKREQCDTAASALVTAREAEATARQTLVDAEAECARYESIVADAAARSQGIDEVKARIRDAHNDQHYAVAYYHLVTAGELKAALDAPPQLVSPDDLEAAIDAALGRKQAAAASLAAAEDATTAAKAAKADCLEQLTVLEAELPGRIDDALKDIHPTTDAAAVEERTSHA